MKQAFSYLADRLKEPSTSASVSAVLIGVGVHVDPGLIHYADLALAGAFGLAGILLREKGT